MQSAQRAPPQRSGGRRPTRSTRNPRKTTEATAEEGRKEDEVSDVRDEGRIRRREEAETEGGSRGMGIGNPTRLQSRSSADGLTFQSSIDTGVERSVGDPDRSKDGRFCEVAIYEEKEAKGK